MNNPMALINIIVLVPILWIILGCLVLTAIDNREKALYNWSESAPILVPFCWPVVAYFWLRQRPYDPSKRYPATHHMQFKDKELAYNLQKCLPGDSISLIGPDESVWILAKIIKTKDEMGPNDF